MQTDKTEEAKANPALEQRVRSLAATFRNILLVVSLLFIFAVVRTIIVWAVCNTGMQAATAMQNQGLPVLNNLASLQENLALFRLDSYEYLFAQEAQKAGDAKAADDLALQMRAELKNIQALFPEGEGRQLAANLEKTVDDLEAQFRKVRGLVDSDFPAAMKSMDHDIPPQTQRVDAAANALKEFGYQFSGAQANATFARFGSIRHAAVIFGITNSLMAFCAFMFVLLAARRSRAQLTETLARLDERTQELQLTNGTLQRQKTELRILFDFVPAMLCFKDTENRVLSVNKRLADFFGKPVGEIEGKTFSEIDPHDASSFFDDDLEVIRSKLPKLGMVEKVLGHKGEQLWLQKDKIPVFDKDWKIVGIVVMAQDITERKWAETKLLESQRFLRSTLDALSSHIAILDEHGTIIEVNAAWNSFARENNFWDSHGVGDNYLKVCDSASGNFSKEAPAVADGIRAVIAGQREEFQLEYPCHSPHEKRWFLVRVTRFGGGGPVRVVVAHENITERKRAESHVRQSEERYRSLIDNARDAVFTIATDGTFTSMNPAVETIGGLSRADWLGKPFAPMVHPGDLPLAVEMFGRVLKGEDSPIHELRGNPSLKRQAIMEMTLTTQKDAAGKIIGVLGIGRDMTERKKLEGQLVQSQKMETVGKLAGGIAHEFNSILTAIIGQSELLLANLPVQSPFAKNASEITKAANRAATLTRQLLAYGGKQLLQPEILDLNRVVADMGEVLQHLMGADVEVQMVPAAGLHAVKADAGQIEQVIMNLVINARDAMPNGGRLTLETANVSFGPESVGRDADLKPGDYVMLAVTDTGVGMNDGVKARLFEPFFSTKGVGGGTGLGLSTCYGIIKQSGGHISVHSELGHGTTFKIYLPQVEAQAKAPVQRLDSPDLPRGKETILLVMDDLALREMAESLLMRLGYTVFAAANGIEALGLKIKPGTGHIDLLFTDVVMPHMKDEGTAGRASALYPNTKILFTTAYKDNADIHPGVAFLQKPFPPSALAKKLREVLDQPEIPKAA
jgi:PAS domain S-box-containing protein